VRLVLAAVVAAILLLPTTAVAGPGPPRASPGLSAGWAAPLAGPLQVTRPFDAPANPYGPGHRGVDLAAAPGEAVLAAGDGVVVFAGVVAGRPVVSIDHPGGLRTTYEPVAAMVGAGQPVARGSPIGTLIAGHAGCPVAACVHWGLRRGEVYLDALLLLRPPRVRLLPLVDAMSGPRCAP
jgi:murein DD-endopeptidase MepM/ murein hydrolase activator NlpD